MARPVGRITVENAEELGDRFLELPDAMRGYILDQSAKEGAEFLEGKIRSAAPRGPTGNLKKGIRSKREGAIGVKRGHIFSKRFANSVTWIVGSFAPHTHLVEFGTTKRRLPNPKRRKGAKRGAPQNTLALKLPDGGYRASVGPMPAHPFVRPTVHSNRAATQRRVSDGLKRRIGGLYRKAI